VTHLIFYEKPGCGGNARQRGLLEAAGHTLERRDLLSAPWTRELLLAFLAPLPVAQWFNRAAPRVKSGEVVPEALDPDQALALLLAEPLLIRRPLMQRTDDGSRQVGFDADVVEAWIGLQPGSVAPGARLEGCASPREVCSPTAHP
jgi:nitrogenase-associated protein